MSPSLQTMGFFMSDINFCETKEQLNHLGEVVTGKTNGSPSGADIDTSTLPYTGQVRKTLPALEDEYQADIDNFVQVSDQVIADKTAEFDASIENKEVEADAAIDAYRLLSKGPYAAGIELEDKFQYITYNGESYFAVNPPYTTTATLPDADGNLFAGGYLTSQQLSLYTDIVYKASGGNSAVDNMVDGIPILIDVGKTCQCENGTVFKRSGNATGGIEDYDAVSQVNVKDFGATGDGITNDTNSIKSALDSFPNNGGKLFFPMGTYSFNETINVPISVILVGQGDTEDETSGRGGTILLKRGDIDGIILPKASGMQDFVVMGDNGLAGDGVSIRGNSVRLVNIFATLHGKDGINVGGDGTAGGSENSNGWHMDSVTSRNNKGRGFTLRGYNPGGGPDVNNGMALHCEAYGNGTDGWLIENAIVNTFLNCYAESNGGRGFVLAAFCQNNTFINPGSEQNNSSDANSQFAVLGTDAYNNIVVGSYLFNVYDPNNLMPYIKATGGSSSHMAMSRRVSIGGGFNSNYAVSSGIQVSGDVRPGLSLIEDSAAADRKVLSVFNDGGNTTFRFYDDDALGVNEWFKTNRASDGSVRRTNFTGGLSFSGALGVGNYEADSGPLGTLQGKFYIHDANGAGIGWVPVYTSI